MGEGEGGGRDGDTYPSPNHHKIIHQNHKSPTAQRHKEQKQKDGKNPRDVIILDLLSKYRASVEILYRCAYYRRFCPSASHPKGPQRSFWEGGTHGFLLSSFEFSAEEEDAYYGLALYPDRSFSHAIL